MAKASVDDKVVDVITADDGTVWELIEFFGSHVLVSALNF
jgi:hypothetical protein